MTSTLTTPVDPTPFDAIAELMHSSYADTAGYSRDFLRQYQRPPTTMAKAHHFLSVLQAELDLDTRFRLGLDYSEYGRVQYQSELGQLFLVRSHSAVTIEAEKRQGVLFSETYIESPVTLLIHKFHQDGLDLSVAGTKQGEGRRLEASGVPMYMGTWPYGATGAPPPPFDQGEGDDFGDVGDIGEEGDGSGLG
jgi:hypothetical protein